MQERTDHSSPALSLWTAAHTQRSGWGLNTGAGTSGTGYCWALSSLTSLSTDPDMQNGHRPASGTNTSVPPK